MPTTTFTSPLLLWSPLIKSGHPLWTVPGCFPQVKSWFPSNITPAKQTSESPVAMLWCSSVSTLPCQPGLVQQTPGERKQNLFSCTREGKRHRFYETILRPEELLKNIPLFGPKVALGLGLGHTLPVCTSSGLVCNQTWPLRIIVHQNVSFYLLLLQ